MTTERPSLLQELKQNLPASPDFIILPPERGDERAPIRSFRMVNSQGILETIIEGHGLSLERAIATETQYFTPEDGGPYDPYDQVFYENGLVAAVVRNFGDGKGTFKVLPIGEQWVWSINEMDEADELEPDDDEKALEAEAQDDDDEKAGIEALHDLTSERYDQRPVAWSVTEGEYLQYHCHHRKTLDEVIAEQVADWSSQSWHQAIWHGKELKAVIRAKPDGTTEVVRV